MINLRKYKYIIVSNGVAEKDDINIIACDTIEDAQSVLTRALAQDLDPTMYEVQSFIRDCIDVDRYGDENRYPTKGMTAEARANIIKFCEIRFKDLENIAAQDLTDEDLFRQERLRKIISKDFA